MFLEILVQSISNKNKIWTYKNEIDFEPDS